ncbi:alpha/beta hydrolase [Streptomyces sp. NPDC004393]|uniref:alpha/beta hydrolase n=1 Tax=Streptomyces sp. NPDC004533 TaxID=3154278 RepID=UPI0033A5154F
MSLEEVLVPVEGGVQLHTWIFRPDTGSGPFPAITMAHGFAGLKYRGLRGYAERFAQAGFVVALHDHRNFALSTGEYRGDIDPWQQIADWRRVISYLESRPDVDSTRIGLWGSSYAGGHALVLAATDRRIKAVVSQVPTISGYEQSLRRVPGEQRPLLEERFNQDERAQLSGEPPATQVLNSLDPKVTAAYRSQAVEDFHDLFPLPDGVEDSHVITLRSTRRAQMYEPGQWIERVSPTPLLMVVGSHDTTTPTDLALAAYERAHEPKQLEIFNGGHYDAYVAAFEQTSAAAESWFSRHLAHD